MKKIIYLLLISSTLLINSCRKDFLDTESLTDLNSDNFYSTPEQIDAALGGIYNSFFIQLPFIKSEPDLTSNILSDDMLAGGGPDDAYVKNLELWEDPTEDTHLGVWKSYYTGIARANVMINKFHQADYGKDEDAKNQALGEAHIMRAFYYFRLAEMFGGLPLLTEPTQDPNQPRASFDDTFALIASDLKKAIDIMPKKPVADLGNRLGHANIWVAEALMARVYLFYTGYSTNMLGTAKDALPLTEGGSVSKNDVSTWLTEMINKSGHKLNDDPRNIWPYTQTSDFGYKYGKTEGLKWVGDGAANLESVFAVKYGVPQTGNPWSPAGRSYVNQLGLFHAIRGNPSLVPFGQGWGWGTVNPALWNAYEKNDIRKKGYILNVKESDEGTGAYKGLKGDHETGFWNKKYCNVQYKVGKKISGMFYNLYGGSKHFILWSQQDQILIRYADVLLMAAELGIDPQANLDAVRTRAKVGSVPPTLENIKKERQLELCFEGLRFYDLLRWGDVASVLTSVNVTVNNSGVKQQYKGVYRAETKGLLPIPESQIRLSGGLLTQNPGW